MNDNINTFKSLNYETQSFLTLVFNYIDFINDNNCKITINEKNNTKKTYLLEKKYPVLGLAIFFSLLHMDSDYKKLLNKEGITISNALKQINKSLKDFNIKKDIRQTTSFKEYNLDEILDEVLENEKEIYDLELNNTSVEDETFDYDINNDDTKVFQFINLLISSPSISNYVKLILKKLYKIDDYYDEVIMPKLIDKLNYDAKEYYLFNYDICVELLDTINNIEYEYDNLNIIQNKDKCFIHFKRQITINNIKIPKYLKVKRIEINNKTYTGVNLLKALLFNEINDKIKFICNNNIEFSINKEILFGKSKQEDNLMASEFVKYLMNIVNEIPSSNTKKEIADILSKIYNVKPQKEKNKSKEEKQMQKEENYLERYGENLTKMHYLKDPSIGRDDIIRKIERILLYPEKDKSIIITGPAGTGKTAVVKGLAYRIQNNLVPEALKDIEIISIDAPSIVSGCKYVGMLEEKLKGILDEACFDKNIILFMDEIHQAIGAGRSEGNKVTVAEILKPYLDYGKVRIIGATTDNEYQENIESNTAFKSRLKRIKLDEPNRDIIYKIIDDLINVYNKISYSKVLMSEEERYDIINFLLDATSSRYRTFNDKVNNPRLVLDIVKEAYAIAALNNNCEVTVDDFIEALNDEERIYESSKQRCIQMLKEKTNYKKEKAIILEFKPKK